ncbi:transcription factor IIIB 50 kDa subunit-like [Ranitomeya imitator]|uniref:transcription factor IIIB 50 kDa subunit-like n=1 Tax=Ranitomeya imitator TaxID=111125 RepID=UPI0037E8D273
MSGGKRCPDCGSREIVEDAHYSQEQLVCADCGFVLTEGKLTSTHTEESYMQGDQNGSCAGRGQRGPAPAHCSTLTEKPPPAVLRLKELKEVCLKLSAQLPWLKRLTINKNNVVYHLGDILKHRTYLFRKALEDVEMATTRSEESKSSDLQHPSAAFLPPCMTKPRKRSHAIAFPNKLQDITGDEDISDSEIEQYLRTPAEMACFQQAQTRLVL